MEPELFFQDPFVDGGWFVFQVRDRLFQWQTVRITTNVEPASRHSSRLKALRFVEKEIHSKLDPIAHSDDNEFYTTQWTNDPLTEKDEIQRTLRRLTYDWEPLNEALSKETP